jgi:ribosomal protein L29
MKAAKLREQTDDELTQQVGDTLSQIYDIRVKKGAGDQSVPPQRVRALRRDVARIRTVIRERKAGQNG